MVISFPEGHFGRNKDRPLSSLMIAALLSMCPQQKEHILITYKHSQGSFISLVSRGLIVSKDIIADGQKETIWEVTPQAIDMLKELGLEIPV